MISPYYSAVLLSWIHQDKGRFSWSHLILHLLFFFTDTSTCLLNLILLSTNFPKYFSPYTESVSSISILQFHPESEPRFLKSKWRTSCFQASNSSWYDFDHLQFNISACICVLVLSVPYNYHIPSVTFLLQICIQLLALKDSYVVWNHAECHTEIKIWCQLAFPFAIQQSTLQGLLAVEVYNIFPEQNCTGYHWTNYHSSCTITLHTSLTGNSITFHKTWQIIMHHVL